MDVLGSAEALTRLYVPHLRQQNGMHLGKKYTTEKMSGRGRRLSRGTTDEDGGVKRMNKQDFKPTSGPKIVQDWHTTTKNPSKYICHVLLYYTKPEHGLTDHAQLPQGWDEYDCPNGYQVPIVAEIDYEVHEDGAQLWVGGTLDYMTHDEARELCMAALAKKYKI